MRFVRIGGQTIAVDCIKYVCYEEVAGPYKRWRIVVRVNDGLTCYPLYGERDAIIDEYERVSAELMRASEKGEETKTESEIERELAEKDNILRIFKKNAQRVAESFEHLHEPDIYIVVMTKDGEEYKAVMKWLEEEK